MLTGMQRAWSELERWASRQVSAARDDVQLLSARSARLKDALSLSGTLAAEQIGRDFHDLNARVIATEMMQRDESAASCQGKCAGKRVGDACPGAGESH